MAVSAIIAAVLGSITWVSSLPPQFKYLFFLGGLAFDSGISAFANFETGAIGGAITFLISNTFNLPTFIVTSWQLLIIFAFLPLVLFMLKNSLSHQ